MERTYRPGRSRTGFDAGEPLLLTPLIEAKKIEEARRAAYVDPDSVLPGMDSYAGYLTVSLVKFVNYYFILVVLNRQSPIRFECSSVELCLF